MRGTGHRRIEHAWPAWLCPLRRQRTRSAVGPGQGAPWLTDVNGTRGLTCRRMGVGSGYPLVTDHVSGPGLGAIPE